MLTDNVFKLGYYTAIYEMEYGGYSHLMSALASIRENLIADYAPINALTDAIRILHPYREWIESPEYATFISMLAVVYIQGNQPVSEIYQEITEYHSNCVMLSQITNNIYDVLMNVHPSSSKDVLAELKKQYSINHPLQGLFNTLELRLNGVNN